MKTKALTTKEKIREKTIEMLNEKGISNVKMRDVSKALNISIGNLTYHYPKWENLMDDIIENFLENVDELYQYFPKDISEVVWYIGRIYDIQMRFAFIFSNYHIFFDMYPKYNAKKEEFFYFRMKVMRDALQRLIDKKYLYPENEQHNYDLLVKNTWLILSGWYSFSKMFEGTFYAIDKEEFFLSLWNLYVYHLTETGKEIVKKSFDDYAKDNLIQLNNKN